MLQRKHVSRVTYLDAFVGPGEYETGQDGSPVFAIQGLLDHVAFERMSPTRERVTLIFIESDRDRCEHLRELLVERFGPLEDLPVSVHVKHGEADKDTLPMLQQTGAWGHPILAVFDSWGNVGVPWSHLTAIALNPSSENIVTFGPNWFSRRETQEPEKLDLVFGGPNFWQPSNNDLTSKDRWREWLETYKGALLRAGHAYALTFGVMPRTGQPLYLVFGTGHPSGVNAFKEAMWKVDTSDGMRFNDPRTTAAKQAAMAAMQPTLFDDPTAPSPELLGFVNDVLGPRGEATVQEVADYLLRETSRWRERDARPAIRYLINEGRILREPAKGRLTRDTRLRRVT